MAYEEAAVKVLAFPEHTSVVATRTRYSLKGGTNPNNAAPSAALPDHTIATAIAIPELGPVAEAFTEDPRSAGIVVARYSGTRTYVVAVTEDTIETLTLANNAGAADTYSDYTSSRTEALALNGGASDCLASDADAVAVLGAAINPGACGNRAHADHSQLIGFSVHAGMLSKSRACARGYNTPRICFRYGCDDPSVSSADADSCLDCAADGLETDVGIPRGRELLI
jgi:hypothetical protein